MYTIDASVWKAKTPGPKSPKRQRLVRTAKSICVELGGRFYGVNPLIKWVFSMDSMFSMGIPGS